MPDTGERTGTANSGFDSSPANAHDGDDSTNASIIQFNSTISGPAIVGGYAGDDLADGVTITGVEIRIRAQFAAAFNSTKLVNVKLSKDGTSGTFNNPSTGVVSQNLTSTVADYTFGGSSETWQHTWSGFTDISNLAVSLEADQQSDSATTAVTGIFAVGVTVHFTEPSAGVGKVTLDGAKIQIVSGKFLID
jgi:hypothetical protein